MPRELVSLFVLFWTAALRMKDYYDWILAFTPTKIYHRSATWEEYNVLYYKYRIVPRDKFAALLERSTFFGTTLITCYL